jgi:maltooligosyltrehalose trehalohydrolase
MLSLGANPTASGTQFRVWAPVHSAVSVVAGKRSYPLSSEGNGYFGATLRGLRVGDRYQLCAGEWRIPDPVSRSLPEGVHGQTEICAPDAFEWTDRAWRGHSIAELVIYELHIGTFTPEGTFDAVIPRLRALAQLGITALEIMPVSAWAGPRNWGYDSASLFAVHHVYGGPDGLKRLVNAAHAAGLSVLLDVVYNHLGPEGNYLHVWGPYFSEKKRTPWGPAINFDGENSRPVRDFFVSNARYWISEYHLDGLRLDAVQTIIDESPQHILAEIQQELAKLSVNSGRPVHVIAESNRNERRLVDPPQKGGYGLAAQWSDDFHHSLHAWLTREGSGYYADFGRLEHLIKALREGFVLQGQHSRYRDFPVGSSPEGLRGENFVIYVQNHDQVGNRLRSDRLNTYVSPAAYRCAVALLLLSPYVPLFFQGQEYSETAPFPFFTSFTDPKLGKAVKEGREREFVKFGWKAEIPDPQDPKTFELACINWDLRCHRGHARVLAWHHALLRIRASWPPALRCDRKDFSVDATRQPVLRLQRKKAGVEAWVNLSTQAQAINWPVPFERVLDSHARQFAGTTATSEPCTLAPFQVQIFSPNLHNLLRADGNQSDAQ